MSNDVEMADANAPADVTTSAPAKNATSLPPTLEQVLDSNLALLRKAVATRETRLLVGRLLRQTATVRAQFTAENLEAFFKKALPENSPVSKLILAAVVQASQDCMDSDAALPPCGANVEPRGSQPEEEVYCFFLLCQLLTDAKRYSTLLQVTQAAVDYIKQFNRRTLDVLAARIYFYYSLANEKHGQLESIRGTLLELHCTSVLRHDDFGQEVLLNLLLRNYLHYKLYEQAEKLRAQAQRPETTRSNQQYCRYLYYLGRIRAVQLEYSEAKECLLQASRKAPLVAKGFAISVSKWLLVIRLLLGEIPERTEFERAGMQAALQPYLELTQAVRTGDVPAFNKVAQQHGAVFQRDSTHNLISRLHHNVIRTGIRRISIAYSKISLRDVAAKLGLQSVEDTESIVAKTIRDGSISAVLDHENQCLCSKTSHDAYMTNEPQQVFHVRTAFCMDIHNEAIKAMRYDKAEDAPVDTAETRAGLEEAIAAAIAGDEDDF